jgi:hypothetical protein
MIRLADAARRARHGNDFSLDAAHDDVSIFLAPATARGAGQKMVAAIARAVAQSSRVVA